MYIHATYTWMLAILLQAAVFLIAGAIMDGEFYSLTGLGFVSDFIILIIISVPFSLPCLLVGGWLMGKIVLSDFTPLAKLLLWLFIAAGIIVLEVLIIGLINNYSIDIMVFIISIPPVTGTWIAILIRYKQFYNLILEQQSNSHENNP